MLDGGSVRSIFIISHIPEDERLSPNQPFPVHYTGGKQWNAWKGTLISLTAGVMGYRSWLEVWFPKGTALVVQGCNPMCEGTLE